MIRLMFQVLTILFALLVAGLGGLALFPQASAKVPRCRWLGMLLGGVCLCWGAYEGCVMLEGDLARFRPFVIALVPLGLAGGWFLLDYLTARSWGGRLVFLANALMHEAFVESCACRPLYCLVCIAWGVAGMVLVASPWHLRRLLEKAASDARWRRALVGVAGGSAALVLALCLF